MQKWSYRTGQKVKIIRRCFGSNLEVKTTCEEVTGKKDPDRLKKFTGMTIQGVSSDPSKDTITSNGDLHQHPAILFQIHYPTSTAKDASNSVSVCGTYPQHQAPLIIHSYTTALQHNKNMIHLPLLK